MVGKGKKKVKAREVVLVADANEFMGLELQMLYCIMSIAGTRSPEFSAPS